MATTDSNAKPEFTVRSLNDLISKINKQFPDELRTNWREFMMNEFLLSADEEKGLSKVTAHQEKEIKEIQEYFVQTAQTIQQGGTLKGKIVKRPIEQQTEDAVHELHLETLPADHPSQASPRVVSVVIAHCDAHCRHWGWGRGSRRLT